MDKRTESRMTFLANAGWAGAKVSILAADASFRSYYRVQLNERHCVLMDAPPPEEDIRPFVTVARYLGQLGFSAPRILAEDPRRGFLLLEDLGDDTYTRVIEAGGDQGLLYDAAVDTLVHLHELSSAKTAPAEIPDYDMDRLLAEAMLFADWYMPAVGSPLGDQARGTFDAAWRSVFAGVADKRETLVLRDYHVDNLMWLPGRSATARCGLLDFQDALIGARAYDLMSLIEDARRDVDHKRADRLIARYVAACGDVRETDLRRDIAILGAGRHAKVIGIFTRLCQRDGKAQYLVHIPRVWRLLEHSLSHPALAPVAEWFAQNVPPASRVTPGHRPENSGDPQ
ncbi:phosphotransferase [Thalassospiraceae bacterium LMO-JJ14]|nr:phosphotransferase [Thalassospiraceae bacterium LMO-JJ14]